MDPKQQLNQLDPKLQEAYNRVMGTASTSNVAMANAGTPASDAASPTPPPTQSPQPPLPPKPAAPQPIPQPPVAPPPPAATFVPPLPAEKPQEDSMASSMPITKVYTPSPSADAATSGFVAATPQTQAEEKKHGISPVILILGGLVFFIIYTLVWIRVFNLSLPFLPQ